MEAFLTDGLRSVLETIPAEDLTEATVRWPGHIDRFIELDGQFDEDALVHSGLGMAPTVSSRGWRS